MSLPKAGTKAVNSSPLLRPAKWSSRTLKVPHMSLMMEMLMMGEPRPTNSPYLGIDIATSPSTCAICTVSFSRFFTTSTALFEASVLLAATRFSCSRAPLRAMSYWLLAASTGLL